MFKNRERNQCIVCKNKKIIDIIDLGNHPFADTFITNSRKSEIESVYPLKCQLCKSCNNIQLKYITNPNSRYNDFEYSYTSSNSNFATSHWDDFYYQMQKRFKLSSKSKILEIGCNDGYLLNNFKKISKFLVGLDASKKMSVISSKKKLYTVNGILDLNSKKKIVKKCKKFNLIIANNVVNHMDNLIDSLKHIRSLLSEDGTFVFEQPYWLDTIVTKRYDQIYHEHITYFTVAFAQSLAKITNFSFYDFEIIEYHGKSLRLYFKKHSENNKFIKNQKKILTQINIEKKNKLFDQFFYKKFMNLILINRNNILRKILEFKSKGFSIICIGAAAKSNTWLNFHKLDSSIISYITDRSVNKINKYTPTSRIKILDDKEIKKEKNPLIIILTWNIYSILKKKIMKINKSAKFLKV